MVKCVKKETDSTFSSAVESEALIHIDWPASNRLKVLFVKTARCVKMSPKTSVLGYCERELLYIWPEEWVQGYKQQWKKEFPPMDFWDLH